MFKFGDSIKLKENADVKGWFRDSTFLMIGRHDAEYIEVLCEADKEIYQMPEKDFDLTVHPLESLVADTYRALKNYKDQPKNIYELRDEFMQRAEQILPKLKEI